MNVEISKPDRNWKESVKTIIEMGKFLERMTTNIPRQDMVKIARVDFNFEESTIKKIIKIARHPILSDPANADKLPPGWGTLYELRFLPDEVLLAKLQADELRYITKYDVWVLRGTKLRRAEVQASQKVKVAEGRSLLQYVRDGIAELPPGAEGQVLDDMAKKLKIGVATFRMIRAMIILSERPELTQSDRGMVLELLDKVDKTRNVRPYYRQVKPMMDGIWGPARNKKYTDKSSKKRADVFRNAIVILRDTCDRVLEMEQPYMSVEDVDESINDLIEARRQMAKLAENLRRSKDD